MAPRSRVAAAKTGAKKADKGNSFTKAAKQAKHVQTSQALVDLVSRRPNLAQQILDYGMKLEEEYKNAPENDCWPNNYYRLKQAFITYMTAVSKQCKPDWKESAWTRLRSQPLLEDNDTITAMERLFYFATATRPDNPIISNRVVCTKVLVDRHEQCGRRLDKVVLQENGWVDWRRTGYFSLVRGSESGKVKEVFHISGVKATIGDFGGGGGGLARSENTWEPCFRVGGASDDFGCLGYLRDYPSFEGRACACVCSPRQVKPPASMSHYTDWVVDKNWDMSGALVVRPNDPTTILCSNCFTGERLMEPEFPELSDEEVAEASQCWRVNRWGSRASRAPPRMSLSVL